MSNLMDELMAELERVNELKNEVERTVAMHSAEMRADREEKGKQIAKFIINLGWKLDKLNDKGYYADLPLDVNSYDGKPLYVNYSMSTNTNGKREMSVYGGVSHCINYRFGTRGIYTAGVDSMSNAYNEPIMNALIDGWDAECERKFEYRIAKIMKESISKQMEAAKDKLSKSNDEYAKYFGKDGE